MIFDLSKLQKDDERIKAAVPAAVKAQFVSVDWSKFEEKQDNKYFVASVTNEDLTRDGKYQHPHRSDVIIRGETQYALEAVLAAKKSGMAWEFQLFLREMLVEQYAPTKEFSRAAQ
jgi:hypothetical protein